MESQTVHEAVPLGLELPDPAAVADLVRPLLPRALKRNTRPQQGLCPPEHSTAPTLERSGPCKSCVGHTCMVDQTVLLADHGRLELVFEAERLA